MSTTSKPLGVIRTAKGQSTTMHCNVVLAAGPSGKTQSGAAAGKLELRAAGEEEVFEELRVNLTG